MFVEEHRQQPVPSCDVVHLKVKRVVDIDVPPLFERGIVNWLLDLDGTLCCWNSEEMLAEEEKFIRHWREQGAIQGICIISNTHIPFWRSRQARVRRVAQEIGTEHYVCADLLSGWKPLPFPFRRAMAMIGAEPGNTVMIGDQPKKDIRGAKALGIHTIQVDNLGGEPWLLRRAKHILG